MVFIIDFGSKKTRDIASAVEKLGYTPSVIKWEECDAKRLRTAEKIILSGAPVLLTEIDYKPYINRFSFLKDSRVPVLGICFGHQLLGMLFGSQIFKGEAVREPAEIEISKENILFKGLPAKVTMMEDHTEGITVPHDFICVARSNKYEVEAMMHVSRPICGVQFHPEVSGNVGERMLGNFLAL